MNKKIDEFNSKLKASKIAFVGLGVSNLPLLDYLYELRCDVTIFSDDEIEIDLSKYGYQVYDGENCLSHLVGFDIIFRSPGCLPTRKEIVDEINRGAYVTTEVQEVIKNAPCKIIGVTGSDGKTTTTTLIDIMLKSNGYKTYLGGNIGTPLFTKISEMGEDDIVILELSSFQLMDMTVSPDVAVITNISPNHLDKHKDYQEYIDSKLNIYKHSNGVLVLNYDNEITRGIDTDREVRYFSKNDKTNAIYIEDGFICMGGKKVIDTNKFKIKGMHNYENISAAISAIYDMVDIDVALNSICEFNGVEHRLEFVRELNGVKWYNDSVSSSPTRTIAGINALDNEKIILIAGGYDKNLDYLSLGEVIVDKVGKLILFGETKTKIYDAVSRVALCNSKTKIKKYLDMEKYFCDSLRQVVNKAEEIAENGEVVLFSPGSASFDMFKDFADRGVKFKNLVNKL